MAAYCALCGKKLGLANVKVALADGAVCNSCWISAGFDMSFKTLFQSHNKTDQQVRDLIEIAVLKVEAEKAGLRKKIDPNAEKAAASTSAKTKTAKAQKAAPAKGAADDAAEPAKPIDIFLFVNEDNEIGFVCKGHPVIDFDDLVNGKELVIGDGFVVNKSKRDLPEVRISCEFTPPIIDTGDLCYQAGLFKAGTEGKIEIDDPPVNLQEYAKVKRMRRGKVALTLFVGDQKISTEECPLVVKAPPAEEISHLIEAVVYETEKSTPGPVNVFLTAKGDGSYTLDLMHRPELLYAMYANGQEQLIGDVYIANDTDHALRDIRFEARFSSDILSPVSMYLGDVGRGENLAFGVDDPAIDVAKLETLTEIESCITTYCAARTSPRRRMPWPRRTRGLPHERRCARGLSHERFAAVCS